MTLTLIFLNRIFTGEVYTTANFYYHFLPWSAEYTAAGTQGALLSDTIDTMYPFIQWFRNGFLQGDLQLWMDHSGLGFSSAQEVVSVLFNPFSWIYLVFPMAIASTVDFFIRLFVGLMGMYVLLKDFRMRPAPCIIGAVIFVFSMPMVVWLNWQHTKVGLLAPWLFWAVRKILVGDRRHIILATVFVQIMLVIGMPAYAAYFFYIVSFYYVFAVLGKYLKSRNFKEIVRQYVLYGIMLGFGVLLAAPYFLPLIENMQFTKYINQRVESNIFLGWSLQNLLHLFDPKYTETVPFSQHFNEIGCYFGIGSLLLALCGMILTIYRKEKNYYYFIILTILLGGCVFSVPGFHLIGKLPLIGYSPATRLIMPLIFITSILASKALDLVFSGINIKTLIGAMSVSILCLVLLFAVGANAVKEFILSRNIVVGMIILGLTIYFLMLFQVKAINKQLLSCGIVVIFAVDLLHGGIGYNPSVIYNKSELAPSTAVTNYLEEELASQRFLSLGKWVLFPNSSVVYGINDLASHNLVMPNNRIQKFYKRISTHAYDSSTRIDFTHINNYFLADLASTSHIVSEKTLSVSNMPQVDLSVSRKAPIGEFINGNVLKQTFIATYNIIDSITFAVATYDQQLTEGHLTYRLMDENGGIVQKGRISNSDLENNSLHEIDFESAGVTKGKTYTLELLSEDSQPGAAPTVWVYSYDRYADNSLEWNGVKQDADLMFQVNYLPENLTYIDKKSGLNIYESTTALPRAYLTGNVELCEDPDILFKTMVGQEDRTKAFVEKALPATLGGNGVQEVKALDITSNRITVETDAAEDNLLVLTDLYYPGWTVQVDGVESELYQTNYLFRGVYVPAGEHNITFVYRPWSFYIGVMVWAVSLLGLILYGIFVIRPWYRKQCDSIVVKDENRLE